MKAIATVSMADLGDMFRTGLGRTMTFIVFTDRFVYL